MRKSLLRLAAAASPGPGCLYPVQDMILQLLPHPFQIQLRNIAVRDNTCLFGRKLKLFHFSSQL